MSVALLSVQELGVGIATRRGPLPVLDRVSFEVHEGEILGLIGESGSGKSMLAHAAAGLLEPAATVVSGRVLLAGQALASGRGPWPGGQVALIFQNPRSALNPTRTVGAQIADVLARHRPAPARAIRARVLALLRQLHVPDPERRLAAYPFQLSGGLCQRIGIAIALASAPRLLIADEPTTGLDTTTQATSMALIRGLVRAGGAIRDPLAGCAARRLAVLLITHDLALAAQVCDRLAILHAGQLVETAATEALIRHPRHPYTRRLLQAAPALATRLDQLQPIPGRLPDLGRPDLPACRFAERCPRCLPRCARERPALSPAPGGAPGHLLACWNPP